MYTASETEVERKVALWWEEQIAERVGILESHACQIKLVIWGRSGWPDHFFFGPNGKMKIIEFKKQGEEPEPLQQHIHRMLRRLGHDVEVHDTVEGACESLARMF